MPLLFSKNSSAKQKIGKAASSISTRRAPPNTRQYPTITVNYLILLVYFKFPIDALFQDAYQYLKNCSKPEYRPQAASYSSQSRARPETSQTASNASTRLFHASHLSNYGSCCLDCGRHAARNAGSCQVSIPHSDAKYLASPQDRPPALAPAVLPPPPLCAPKSIRASALP